LIGEEVEFYIQQDGGIVSGKHAVKVGVIYEKAMDMIYRYAKI
jgi:hypothetical protein